jgi:uncharacterized protein with von Willebrand factor type A (vWA) domain
MPDPATQPSATNEQRPSPGGIIHSYQRYDPKEFPSPTAPAPDIAGQMMDHMLAYGDLREFSEEELARAIRLDPSMFPKLGPSLAALRAMLEERKRRILATYEVGTTQRDASREFREGVEEARSDIPDRFRKQFEKATREEQLADLEKLWYAQKNDQSPAAQALMGLMQSLAAKYQVEELASKYHFTGREALDVEHALAVKDELETIDKLLEQLRDAEQNAQLAIIDMDDLAQFAELEGQMEQMESLNQLQQQIQDYIRQEAQRQGFERTREGFRLTPNALRVFQKRLLSEIFNDLEAARSGRHDPGISGDGAVEIEKTKPYEFGDSASNIDTVQTLLNSLASRSKFEQTQTSAPSNDTTPLLVTSSLRHSSSDLAIHLTRNNPKCATAICMDMSGSMRYDGQYINVKRMALAMDGLIRSEYPGDHVSFIEMYSIAKLRHASEVASMLPKLVSIHAPRVRLKADMSDPRISELQLPQHFTNIQHALQLSRQVLQNQDTPNRQIILITDGLPTAHFEGKDIFFLYPPDPLTESATMREAALCQRAGITINIFLLPNWNQNVQDIRFAHRLAERTKGRVFFTAGKDLDRYVVWDYVKQRRKIVG